MHHIAIIGSGPAGFYTAEACQKIFGDKVQIDFIDRLPSPFGLIRSGVAPDHQSIKAVTRRYEAVATSENVRFYGNVSVGETLSIEELLDLYDAVVLATGAPNDRKLGIPGDDLPGVVGSAGMVGWYNGHPDHAALNPPLKGTGAVIVGNGNVALDVARILSKTRTEFAGSDIVTHAIDALDHSNISHVTILGRRGPHQIAMTPKELAELGYLSRAAPKVDPADLPPASEDALLEPGMRKSVELIRQYAANPPSDTKPITIEFDFFAKPVALEGDGKVERMIVERTRLDHQMQAVGTGETYAIPCELVVSCIGYRTPHIPGVPYDEHSGRFANVDGRILPGLYCVGWARRGPSGTIGTNKPDGAFIADQIAADHPIAAGKAGRAGLDALLKARHHDVVTFEDWQTIDVAEVARARDESPREKFVHVNDMIAAKGA
ncbi:FAD-dependent oxidoreductase [Aquisediminimonas sediminicola]|uniref:FAD-dependent oxidoreductase n=1 Tax=Alteraquisediminimonas sediminicola TaxID=2676787 RepID=UPI001C8D9BFE|nr:FAD-dependent oxidoreductase [Aquisediminimonas sediminicola]